MGLKRWYPFMVLTIVMNVAGCFERNVQCNINGVEVNDDLLGTQRKDILRLFGEPFVSDLNIKGFEDYSYIINNKPFGLVLHYILVNGEYRIESYKCIKAKPRIEVSKYVIWH